MNRSEGVKYLIPTNTTYVNILFFSSSKRNSCVKESETRLWFFLVFVVFSLISFLFWGYSQKWEKKEAYYDEDRLYHTHIHLYKLYF